MITYGGVLVVYAIIRISGFAGTCFGSYIELMKPETKQWQLRPTQSTWLGAFAWRPLAWPRPKQESLVQGSGFRVQGSGFRTQGSGFRV